MRRRCSGQTRLVWRQAMSTDTAHRMVREFAMRSMAGVFDPAQVVALVEGGFLMEWIGACHQFRQAQQCRPLARFMSGCNQTFCRTLAHCPAWPGHPGGCLNVVATGDRRRRIACPLRLRASYKPAQTLHPACESLSFALDTGAPQPIAPIRRRHNPEYRT